MRCLAEKLAGVARVQLQSHAKQPHTVMMCLVWGQKGWAEPNSILWNRMNSFFVWFEYWVHKKIVWFEDWVHTNFFCLV